MKFLDESRLVEFRDIAFIFCPLPFAVIIGQAGRQGRQMKVNSNVIDT